MTTLAELGEIAKSNDEKKGWGTAAGGIGLAGVGGAGYGLASRSIPESERMRSAHLSDWRAARASEATYRRLASSKGRDITAQANRGVDAPRSTLAAMSRHNEMANLSRKVGGRAKASADRASFAVKLGRRGRVAGAAGALGGVGLAGLGGVQVARSRKKD